MAHLVGRHKQHIADDELDRCLALLRGEAIEAWLVCERVRKLVDPGLKFRQPGFDIRRRGRNHLRKQRLRPQPRENKQHTGETRKSRRSAANH